MSIAPHRRCISFVQRYFLLVKSYDRKYKNWKIETRIWLIKSDNIGLLSNKYEQQKLGRESVERKFPAFPSLATILDLLLFTPFALFFFFFSSVLSLVTILSLINSLFHYNLLRLNRRRTLFLAITYRSELFFHFVSIRLSFSPIQISAIKLQPPPQLQCLTSSKYRLSSKAKLKRKKKERKIKNCARSRRILASGETQRKISHFKKIPARVQLPKIVSKSVTKFVKHVEKDTFSQE